MVPSTNASPKRRITPPGKTRAILTVSQTRVPNPFSEGPFPNHKKFMQPKLSAPSSYSFLFQVPKSARRTVRHHVSHLRMVNGLLGDACDDTAHCSILMSTADLCKADAFLVVDVDSPEVRDPAWWMAVPHSVVFAWYLMDEDEAGVCDELAGIGWEVQEFLLSECDLFLDASATNGVPYFPLHVRALWSDMRRMHRYRTLEIRKLKRCGNGDLLEGHVHPSPKHSQLTEEQQRSVELPSRDEALRSLLERVVHDEAVVAYKAKRIELQEALFRLASIRVEAESRLLDYTMLTPFSTGFVTPLPGDDTSTWRELRLVDSRMAAKLKAAMDDVDARQAQANGWRLLPETTRAMVLSTVRAAQNDVDEFTDSLLDRASKKRKM